MCLPQSENLSHIWGRWSQSGSDLIMVQFAVKNHLKGGSDFWINHRKLSPSQMEKNWGREKLSCGCSWSSLVSQKGVVTSCQVIHPSIHFLYPFNPSVGSQGGWNLSQQSSGERRGDIRTNFCNFTWHFMLHRPVGGWCTALYFGPNPIHLVIFYNMKWQVKSLTCV